MVLTFKGCFNPPSLNYTFRNRLIVLNRNRTKERVVLLNMNRTKERVVLRNRNSVGCSSQYK